MTGARELAEIQAKTLNLCSGYASSRLLIYPVSVVNISGNGHQPHNPEPIHAARREHPIPLAILKINNASKEAKPRNISLNEPRCDATCDLKY